jgi:hypothetical protein
VQVIEKVETNNTISINLASLDYRTVFVNKEKFILGVNKQDDDYKVIEKWRIKDYPEFYAGKDGGQYFICISNPNTTGAIGFGYDDNGVLGSIFFAGLVDPKIIELPKYNYDNYDGSGYVYNSNGIVVLADSEFKNGMIYYVPEEASAQAKSSLPIKTGENKVQAVYYY